MRLGRFEFSDGHETFTLYAPADADADELTEHVRASRENPALELVATASLVSVDA